MSIYYNLFFNCVHSFSHRESTSSIINVCLPAVSNVFQGIMHEYTSHVMKKPTCCICVNKVTAKLISAFVFATSIVKFLFVLNLKLPASDHLLCLHSSVCVGPARKPHCWFSHDTAHMCWSYLSRGFDGLAESNDDTDKGEKIA